MAREQITIIPQGGWEIILPDQARKKIVCANLAESFAMALIARRSPDQIHLGILAHMRYLTDLHQFLRQITRYLKPRLGQFEIATVNLNPPHINPDAAKRREEAIYDKTIEHLELAGLHIDTPMGDLGTASAASLSRGGLTTGLPEGLDRKYPRIIPFPQPITRIFREKQ